MCLHIFHILEFPGIISFPENYPPTIRISRNSGNFLQSGNTGVGFYNHALTMERMQGCDFFIPSHPKSNEGSPACCLRLS